MEGVNSILFEVARRSVQSAREAAELKGVATDFRSRTATDCNRPALGWAREDTQQFNTTTSMGRLTLNVLLSFAQFEREVTSERIRDKIAASKRKGLWVGGNLPIGYKMMNGKITIVERKPSWSDPSSGDTWNLAASTNCYGTSENATSGPKPGCCPRVRRAAGSRSGVARCTTC